MSDNLRWTVGSVAVTRVEETITPIDATVLIPDFTAAHLEPHRHWLVPSYFSDDGRLRLSVHSFVVESQGTTIVVDTCVGPQDDRLLPNDPAFIDRLASSISGGLPTVDVVLCTHLHMDHVGWNTVTVDGRWVPTFPNARYLVTAAELRHLDGDDPMEVREPSVQPLVDAGVLDAVTPDHVITSEVRLVPTPGHTPGHVSVLVESEGAAAMITGDLAHTPLQFAHPDLPSAAFDWDPAMSSATRERIIESYTNTDTIVLGTHFAPPTGGTIKRRDGYTWFES